MKGNYNAECFAEKKTKSERAQGSVRSKTSSVPSKMGSGSRFNLFIMQATVQTFSNAKKAYLGYFKITLGHWRWALSASPDALDKLFLAIG